MIVIMGLSWSATEELVRLGLWHIIISISYCAGLFASSVPCVVPPTLIFPLPPPPPPPPPKYQRATPIPFRGTGSQRRSTSLSENARRKRGARASPPPPTPLFLPISVYSNLGAINKRHELHLTGSTLHSRTWALQGCESTRAIRSDP